MANFILRSPESVLCTSGIKAELPGGVLATAADRVSSFLAATEDGPRLVVGALPYARDAHDYLFQPAALLPAEAPGAAAGGPGRVGGGQWIVTPQPSPDDFAASVAAALREIGEGAGDAALRKVVLSRSLDIRTETRVDADALLRSLSADPSVTAFSTPLPQRGGAQPQLVGATPELLVSRRGETVRSHPLAGSARRHADPAADRQSAEALLASDKDRREHKAVVEAVLDALAPWCRELATPETMTLRPTATMWHLGTRIEGRLKDDGTPVMQLAAALHPTPAVCGEPRERADALIRRIEGYDRGFYAGAVGWADARGDGDWYVTLRCAEIAGTRLRLYAGAGIVAGSDPTAEVDETSAKFLAMLNALGVDEQGRRLAGQAA